MKIKLVLPLFLMGILVTLFWGEKGEADAIAKGYDEKVIVQSIRECNDCYFESRYQVKLSNGKLLKASSLNKWRYEIGKSIHIRYENGEIEYAGKGTANVKKRINGKVPESSPSILTVILISIMPALLYMFLRYVNWEMAKKYSE